MQLQEAVRDAIVVAVDGSASSEDAVAWGAEQAALEGRRLVVAHAETQAPALANPEALSAAAARWPGLQVDQFVSETSPRHLLVEASRAARLLVLGSRGRGVLRSVFLGSVGASVMRHAECPVVVTRHPSSRWKAGVLVGADGTAESRPVVEFAFRMASLRGLPLTVMHTTFNPDVADDTIEGTSGSTAVAELRLALAESVAGFGERYPDVDVARRIVLGLTDEGLVRGQHPWDLIVVGRHPRHSVLDSLGGAVSTSVLERFHGVVAMVPQPAPASGPYR